MQTKTKLIVLELLSGLLGWLWILAGLAAVYFLIAAVAFEGAWSRFFWAVGVSVIAKWLTRGVLDHKQRIALEANLVTEGYSPEEGSPGVVRQYAGGASQPDFSDTTAADAEKIIQTYGALLTDSIPTPGTVADVSRLPYSKTKIKEAILLALSATDDLAQKESLKMGYVQLADFQDGVGSVDVGLDVSKFDLENTSTEELAKQVLEQSEGADGWQALVKKEQELLKSELQAAGHWSSEP